MSVVATSISSMTVGAAAAAVVVGVPAPEAAAAARGCPCRRCRSCHGCRRACRRHRRQPAAAQGQAAHPRVTHDDVEVQVEVRQLGRLLVRRRRGDDSDAVGVEAGDVDASRQQLAQPPFEIQAVDVDLGARPLVDHAAERQRAVDAPCRRPHLEGAGQERAETGEEEAGTGLRADQEGQGDDHQQHQRGEAAGQPDEDADDAASRSHRSGPIVRWRRSGWPGRLRAVAT